MYKVICNHKNFLLIHKDWGVSVHSEEVSAGLVQILREELKIDTLFVVHRLDKMTSGLMLLAKNRETAGMLSHMFRSKLIEKYYLAISDRRPKKRQGLIKGDMERSRRGSWKLTRSLNNPAMTQFFSVSLGEGRRLFLLRPLTGKTHQIRVALKSIGAPVMGDLLYHSKEGHESIDRPYLHSYAVRFHLEGKEYTFTLIPDEGIYFVDDSFRTALEKIKSPWELEWPTP